MSEVWRSHISEIRRYPTPIKRLFQAKEVLLYQVGEQKPPLFQSPMRNHRAFFMLSITAAQGVIPENPPHLAAGPLHFLEPICNLSVYFAKHRSAKVSHITF